MMLYCIFVFFFICNTEALYFIMRESETKCFLEEMPSDTQLSARYKLTTHGRDARPRDLTFGVQVRDPENNLILSRVYSNDGRIAFTSQVPGQHVICLSTNSSHWFGGDEMKVDFDIATGDHAFNYQELVARDKLTELQLRARQLLDQVIAILKEQDYHRVREEKFRRLSESTNQRVTYWSIAQLLLLIALGFWQMRNLRAFFQAKKLV